MLAKIKTKYNFVVELIHNNKPIVRKGIYICFISSIGFMLVTGSIYTLLDRSLESRIYTRKLKDYREYLAKFYSQDYSVFSLTSKTSGKINKELSKFVNSNTICVEFYHSDKSVGTFGRCVGQNFGRTDQDGWQITDSGIILVERFKQDLKTVTVLTNEYNASISTNGFLLPVSFHNLKNVIPNVIWSTIAYLFIYWLIAIAIVFYRIKEKSADIIHDFSKLSTNIELTASKIKKYSKDEAMVNRIADNLLCLTVLADACSHNSPVEVSTFNLGEFVDDFINGYFIHKKEPGVIVHPFNRNLYIKCDKLYVFKILVNLFSNAEKAANKSGSEISFAILEKPDSVQFIISNTGNVESDDVFEKKFSIFESNGRGLPTVAKTAKLIGSDVTISNSGQNVAVSFNIPLDLESSCPALFFV